MCSAPEGILSDSEEDRGPEAMAQQNATSVWSSEQSPEQRCDSSEASSEHGERPYCWILSHFYSARRKYSPAKMAATHTLTQHALQ